MADQAFNTAVGEFGIGQSILGGLTSAFSSILSGQDQRRMYDYQAGVARLNEQISLQNAEYARQTGELSAERYGLAAGQRMGQIRAAQASTGLDVNSGSAAQVRASQRNLSAMDTATIRSESAKTAYNYEVQGTQYEAQAQLDTTAGKSAAAAGFIGAASSMVGTASSVSSEWLKGQTQGLWGS